MLYVLGGSSRSGKSIIARRFVAERQTPFFCIDFLITLLQDGVPTLEIKHGLPFVSKAEKLWPLVRPLLTHLVSGEPKYLIEGDGLLPKDIAELIKDFPDEIRACFVGFAEITNSEKLRQVRKFGGNQDDWARKYSDAEMVKFIEEMVKFSKYLKSECKKYKIPYFDCSDNFEEYLEDVFKYLEK